MARKRNFTIPLALVGGLMPGLMNPVKQLMVGNLDGAMKHIQYNYALVDANGKFNLRLAERAYVPLFVGAIVHWLAGRLGINQRLGRAGVPIIRI